MPPRKITGTAPSASIFGLTGPVLTPEERLFFQETDPLGFILFARNCVDPEQLRALTDLLHDLMGRTVPILIDQEGGRVQRLKAPLWTDYPPAQSFGGNVESVKDAYQALARELGKNGITVDCAPVLDVLFPETHDIIGNRAFGNDPETVAACGAAACEAFLEEGIIPIIKHIPGHGRARADLHLELPVVKESIAELRQRILKRSGMFVRCRSARHYGP